MASPPEPHAAAPRLSTVTAVGTSSLKSPTRPPPHLHIPDDDHPLHPRARRAARSASDTGKRRDSPGARASAGSAASPANDEGHRPSGPANGASGGFTSPDAELLGIGPSRRRRERDPQTTTTSSRDSPQRPRASSYHALDSLGRDELALLDARFEDMGDGDIAAFLAPYERGWDVYRAKRAEEEEAAARLFPPSPPGERRDHPLKVLSRAVRELREVVVRLEDDNARLREERERERVAGGGASRRGSEPVSLPVVNERQSHSHQVSKVLGVADPS